MSKVIYETSGYEAGRYEVESIRDSGWMEWTHRESFGIEDDAIRYADALIRESGHYMARVVDTNHVEGED